MPEQSAQKSGRIIEIKGVVIDVVFPEGGLPEIYTALRIALPDGKGDLIAEVQQHLGDDRVRAVAMDATDGIPRGVDIVDTGAPITVPVGKQTLGRLWNVLGEPIDEGEEVAADAERWPIHRDRANTVVAEVLLHLRDQVASAVRALDLERGVDLRQTVGEDRVDDYALDLDDLADVLLAVLLVRHVSPGEVGLVRCARGE